jgi:hypothetical protein
MLCPQIKDHLFQKANSAPNTACKPNPKLTIKDKITTVDRNVFSFCINVAFVST